MRTNLLWPEFLGVQVAALAVLAGMIVAIRGRRVDRALRLAAAYGFASQGVGVLLFVFVVPADHWMMQHFHGPPVLLLSALGGLLAGIGATLAGGVLAVVCRRAGATPRASVRGCMCWASLLVLTLLSGLLSWSGLSWLPRVMASVRLSHFDALERRGAAALPQLIAGDGQDPPYRHGRATFCARPRRQKRSPTSSATWESRTAQAVPTEAV